MTNDDITVGTTNASIDKAVVTLIASGAVALIGMLTTGTADMAELLVIASGLVTVGITYLVKYSPKLPYKAAVALALPLIIAVVRGIQTGEVDEAEVQLAVQAILGAVLAYIARRRVPTARNNPNVANN